MKSGAAWTGAKGTQSTCFTCRENAPPRGTRLAGGHTEAGEAWKLLTLPPPVPLHWPPPRRVDTGSTSPAIPPSGTAISVTASTDPVFHFDFSILPSTAPQCHHVFKRKPQNCRRSKAFHSVSTCWARLGRCQTPTSALNETTARHPHALTEQTRRRGARRPHTDYGVKKNVRQE